MERHFLSQRRDRTTPLGQQRAEQGPGQRHAAEQRKGRFETEAAGGQPGQQGKQYAADAAAGEALRTLIGTSKANVFIAPSAAPSDPPSSGRKKYVLNTKTMKFHLPGCTEVTRITEENRKNTTTTRESLIDQGYVPCQKCNP